MPAKCEIRSDVQGEAVKLTHRRTRIPIAPILASRPLVVHPDRRSCPGPVGAHTERGESLDHPVLHPLDEPAHISAASAQVEHNVPDPLAGAVISDATATPGAVDRKALLVEQLVIARARSAGVNRRVLQQPDRLRRGPADDGLDRRSMNRTAVG